jgi:hypothetical protein
MTMTQEPRLQAAKEKIYGHIEKRVQQLFGQHGNTFDWPNGVENLCSQPISARNYLNSTVMTRQL